MDNRRAIRAAVYLAIAAFLTLPAEAQNATGDPHAHDWYKEQVQGKIDPATGEKIPQAAGTPATGTPATSTNTGSSPPATATPNSATNDTLNQSLGGVDHNYRGKHKYYNDDFLGNFFDIIGPIGLTAIVAIIGLVLWLTSRKKKSTDQASAEASSPVKK